MEVSSLPESQRSPMRWVQASLQEVGMEVSRITFASEALTTASKADCAVCLFVDELPALYIEDKERSHHDDWAQIHSFVSNTQPSFAMASGSHSRLPLLVRGTDRNAIKETTDVQSPFDSLNETKLKIRQLPTFHTLEHYEAYFNGGRQVAGVSSEELKDSKQRRHLFTRMHTETGGVLRSIRAFAASKPLTLSHPNFPSENSLLGKVYRLMAKDIAANAEAASMDPFDVSKFDKDKMKYFINCAASELDIPREDLVYEKSLADWTEHGFLFRSSDSDTDESFLLPKSKVLRYGPTAPCCIHLTSYERSQCKQLPDARREVARR
eukprot:gb/GECG01005734.1/.p1 GENE.gb/GECG01005734.1/~~gb/GECG01005734.1/.p1  ORF type:complete len:324 (+),score=31.23 gb/GECG01005734.1/:1-972(+)